ncbi:hypothetical protein X757_31770 [Mesorhizobium sp. LSHC414A00]|nr:hypothetical protein X757_31770 [Mesorhizobium sp. LSHC414A00]
MKDGTNAVLHLAVAEGSVEDQNVPPSKAA